MATLEKRIETLEQASPIDNMEPIFIHFVGLNTKDGEIQRIAKGNQEWQRQSDESEQVLKERAKREVKPPKAGCCTVFLCH